jgi:integrase
LPGGAKLAPRRYTIGEYSPDLTAEQARDKAIRLRGQIREGIDPAAEKRAAAAELIAAKEAKPPKAVGDVLDDFEKRHVKGLRSKKEVERVFRVYIRPTIGEKPIAELRRSHIVEMLDKIEDENGPVMADRALAHLRKALTWHAARDDEFNSPIVRGMARTRPKERARKRSLADDEIRDVWGALDKLDGPFPAIVRTLLLTAQRRDEVARMQESELQEDWIIPPERYKTDLTHAVPLTKEARAIIDDARKLPKGTKRRGPFVFSTTEGEKPFQAFSDWKAKLDEKVAAIRKKEGRDPMPPWVLHDLRRTGRSLMSRAGVNGDVAELVLGHVIPGVRGTYDRWTYLAEKRDALEKLAALIGRILEPPAGNVVQLHQERESAA